jgi:hypothetical protein
MGGYGMPSPPMLGDLMQDEAGDFGQGMPGAPTTFLNEENIRKFGSLDPGVWSRRDTRMLRHRRLFELVKPPRNKLKPGQGVSVTTDAKAIVFKYAGMFANHPPSIECISDDPSAIQAAERCSDFCRSYRRKEIKRYARGPHGPRPYDEAVYAIRDGTIAEMVLWNPDPAKASHPYDSRLLDPMSIYVTYDGDEAKRITWKYRTTLAEAKSLCAQEGNTTILPDVGTGSFHQDSMPIDVVKVCTNEGGSWELGIMVRNALLCIKPIGYNPFIITHVNARVYDSTTVGELSGTDRYENVGVGVFDVIEEAIKNKNETYSIMREMMKRDANPPRVIFTDDEGKLDQLKFEPGQNIHLWADDKFQLVQLTPDFRKLSAVMEMDQQSISRGTVPDALWGEGPGSSSAAEYMALGNARDQLYVFQDALQLHAEAKYEHILALYKSMSPSMAPNVGPPGATFTSTNPTSGIKLGGQAFTVQDVAALGDEIDVCVTYSDVTPQNEAARANMAATLVDKKIIDLHTSRQMIPAPYNEQPELIGQRVLQDISLMHPMMTQIMAMTAALYSPDPVQKAIAGLMLPSLIGQAQAEAATPPGGQPGGGPPTPAGGPHGGANPTPGQNGVPAQNSQMHPTVNPAESGNRAGIPEGQSTAQNTGSQPGQPSR